MASYLGGLLCALAAAVCFGLQYVPVKKYEIYDGSTFQWFMSSGILMTGFVVSLANGEADKGCPLEVIIGGILWAISNYAVLPLVRLLGIGVGFSLYHFVNLVIGYLSGRFGAFGLKKLAGETLWACDVGCALICVSFGIMVLVEDHVELTEAEAASLEQALEPSEFTGMDEQYRAMYHQWRRGMARGSRDPLTGMPAEGTELPAHDGGVARANSDGDRRLPGAHISTFQAFGATTGSFHVVHGAPGSDASAREVAIQEEALSADSQGDLGRRPRDKLLGVGLAILGGGLCGIQAVPSSLYLDKHPELTHTAVVLPQCLGVWLGATLIYNVYSCVAKASGWSVPHSVIRPAFISGCMWAIGFTCMIAAIAVLGYSVGYTLDAVGPIIVSSLLSVFVFKEISGRKQLTLYVLSLSLQLTGTVLIAAFGQ